MVESQPLSHKIPEDHEGPFKSSNFYRASLKVFSEKSSWQMMEMVYKSFETEYGADLHFLQTTSQKISLKN